MEPYDRAGYIQDATGDMKTVTQLKQAGMSSVQIANLMTINTMSCSKTDDTCGLTDEDDKRLRQEDGSTPHVNTIELRNEFNYYKDEYLRVLTQLLNEAKDATADTDESTAILREINEMLNLIQSVIEQLATIRHETNSSFKYHTNKVNEEIRKDNQILKALQEQLDSAVESVESGKRRVTFTTEKIRNRFWAQAFTVGLNIGGISALAYLIYHMKK